MTQLLDTVLTPWRVKWYSRGALLALAVAFLVVLLSGAGPQTLTGRIGGDYPAFYSAGQIIADGAAEQLYSPQMQRDYQQPLIGAQSGVLLFAYPPQFAMLYAPLAELPFRLSYAIHTLALVAALALACVLIQRIYPTLIASPYLLFFLALTSYPIIRSVMGGQNTALSILLIVLVWYMVLHDRQLLAGVILGLLFFKPQFALPLTGLFLLSGRWRVWGAAAATAGTLFVLNTAIIGPGWVGDWLALVQTFSRLDVQVNFAELVSWQGFLQALLGDGNTIAVILGWAMTAATILVISWVWFAGGRTADFNAQIGLASIAIVLISPHTLFYDAGVAIIGFIALLGRRAQLNKALILGVWAASFLQLLSPILGISLSFLPLMFVLVLAIGHLWSRSLKPMEMQPA